MTYKILIAQVTQGKIPPWWDIHWLHPRNIEALDPLEALVQANRLFPHFQGKLAVEPLK